MKFENSIDFARELDSRDELAAFRNRFHIPQHNGSPCVYFTGNSLGLQPVTAKNYVMQEMEDWASLGVEGHFKARRPWFSYHENFPHLVAPVVGALPQEVVVMNQLTVNLHLLMASFYRPDAGRYKIICEAKAFPSDLYALESQARLHGLDPEKAIIALTPAGGGNNLSTEEIINAIQQHAGELSMVMLGGVNYYSGQVLDMQQITRAAHEAGALAGFDLAHAAGNISLKLHDWNVDFACWCSYKYLNSGPGGVAGIYIHEKHTQNTGLPRMAGWWGYEKETRFKMQPGFKAIPTAEGWQLSNAPVLSMAAHLAALEIFAEAGMERLIQKSRMLTGFLFYILDEINASHTNRMIEVITPRGEGEYGCQVSMLMLARGREVFDALIAQGVIADWREPNVIRVAPVPLYNSFEDVFRFGSIMSAVLKPEA